VTQSAKFYMVESLSITNAGITRCAAADFAPISPT